MSPFPSAPAMAAIVLAVVLQGPNRAVITNPQPGALIQDRLVFPVSGSIEAFERDRATQLHYWISLATVETGAGPALHWPKFYVKQAQFSGEIYDGGQNPLPTPQPMHILLLRVDDATSQRYARWLSAGPGSGYVGFPVKSADVVARVPIKFP